MSFARLPSALLHKDFASRQGTRLCFAVFPQTPIFSSGAEGIRTPDLRRAKAEVTREQLLLTRGGTTRKRAGEALERPITPSMIWRYHEKKAGHSGRLLGVLADTEADTIDTNADTNVASEQP
jgi:hypothetical protein